MTCCAISIFLHFYPYYKSKIFETIWNSKFNNFFWNFVLTCMSFRRSCTEIWTTFTGFRRTSTYSWFALTDLLTKEAVTVVEPCEDQYISSYFAVPKPRRVDQFRPILNLKLFNFNVRKYKFTMETLQSVREWLKPGFYCVSLDIKDAYLHIPVHKGSRKYLRFKWQIIQTTSDRIIFIYWVLKHNVQLCCCTLKSLLSQMSNLQLLHKGKMAYWHIRCVGFHVHRCGYSISKPGNTLAYWRCRTYYAPCRSPACPESLFGRWLPEQ